MSAEEDVIKIPKRLLFIAIIICLCINIFSVLMGILIGKGDLQWERRTAEPTQDAQTVSEDPLDREMALFDEPEPARDERVDLSGYDTTPAPAERRAATPPPKPAETNPTPRPTSPTAAPSQSGPAYWVQIAALKDSGKAKAFQRRITEKGYGAQVRSEGAFYKIMVGPYVNRAEASRAKTKLDREFKAKGWVREL